MEIINDIIPVKWSKRSIVRFSKDLGKFKDLKYLDFNKKIIFTNKKMIGIRVPVLRRIAREIKKTNFIDFLDFFDESSFEMVFLYGIILSYISDFEIFIKYFNIFLEMVDNWAVCDMCLTSIDIIKNNREEMLKYIKMYVKSEREFICRVGVILLLYYYLNDKYINEVIDIVSCINNNKYYVNMAIGWLLSETFISYKKLIFNNLNRFDDEIINICVCKIRDSKRVDINDKNMILKYKKKVA